MSRRLATEAAGLCKPHKRWKPESRTRCCTGEGDDEQDENTERGAAGLGARGWLERDGERERERRLPAMARLIDFRRDL
jgi:hypothetical protein